jgi:hypothetical protein
MIIEMRTYTTKPESRERFLKIFCEKPMLAHSAIGMKVLGPFPSCENSDMFFFHAWISGCGVSRADESKVL